MDAIGDVDKPILTNNIAAAINTTFLSLKFACTFISWVFFGRSRYINNEVPGLSKP